MEYWKPTPFLAFEASGPRTPTPVITSMHSPSAPQIFPNPRILARRKVTLVVYTVLTGTAPVILIIYACLWAHSISPPLDLIETGNLWTYILLFVTCALAFACGSGILICHWKGVPLRWKHVVNVDLIMILCWLGILMVSLGGAEEVQDRSRCHEKGVKCTKQNAPSVTTEFGHFIIKVCGYNKTDNAIPSTASTSIAKDVNETILGGTEKNVEKCAAAYRLKTSIYCMYIWGLELLIVVMIEVCFGLGNYEGRNDPEYLRG